MHMNSDLKFNPSFLNDDEIIRGFTVRHDYLRFILQTITDNTDLVNRHILVVGPRGIGKTTLVIRVAAEIRSSQKLTNSWYPIQLAEEIYSVASAGEFWLETLFHLQDKAGNPKLSEKYYELLKEQDDKVLHDRALGVLLDFSTSNEKRLLVIVENLNTVFDEQMSEEDGWTLRHTLQNNRQIMLLGTATSRFEEITNIDKALFEQFQIIDLPSLNLEECVRLWSSITSRERSGRDLRPIQILTGGNPRLLKILAEFTVRNSLRELLNELVQLIDQYTDYFKSKLDSLAPKERKVFVALLDLWDPSTAKEVALYARTTINQASAMLTRLEKRGAVIKRGRGAALYQASERLLNIYYLMRRRGNPSNRVRALTEFMIQYYEGDQLVEKMTALAQEACKLEPSLRSDHYMAYGEILRKTGSQNILSKILEATPKEFFQQQDASALVSEFLNKKQAAEVPEQGSDVPVARNDSDDLSSQIKATGRSAKKTRDSAVDAGADVELMRQLNFGQEYVQKGQFSKAEHAYRTAIELSSDYDQAWGQLGQLLHEYLERYDEAEQAYRKAIELNPDYVWAWAQLGQLLHENLGRYDEAEQAYRKAIELKPDYGWAWAQLGELLHENMERYEEAEQAYRKAIADIPDSAWLWGQLGQLLHENLGRYDEAEQAYQKTIEIAPNHAWPLAQLGQLLQENLGRYDEAKQAYRKALELSPDYAWAWGQLGQLLHENLEHYDEAEQAYRKAIELKPDYGWAWGQLGQLLHENLGRFDEAEQAYRRTVELMPDYGWAWAQLGELLHENMERYEEAEQAYRKANALIPDSAWLWGQLGQLLHENLERYDEAEQAYHKALVLNPANIWVWGQLGKLLHNNLKRYDEAEQTYRKALELKPDYGWAWGQLGQLLHENLGRYDEAEQAYRKALELMPDYAWLWGQLGQLLHENLERYDEAEQAYRKVIADFPDSAWLWGQLGQLLHENLGRHDEAEQAYRKALELSPDYAWTWGQLGQLLHENLEHYDEAEQAYRKAIELIPDYGFAWGKLGQLLHENLERHDEAEQVYRKAIAFIPNSAWLWGQLGQLLHENLARYDEAEQAFRKALELTPDYAWAWGQLGQLLHENLERYDEAEQAYRKAFELRPDYGWAWGQLGQLLHENLGRYDEAEHAYRKALELIPDYTWAWLGLAGMHRQLHQDLKAERSYLEAYKLQPVIARPILFEYLLEKHKTSELAYEKLRLLTGTEMKAGDVSSLAVYALNTVNSKVNASTEFLAQKALQMDSANIDALYVYAMAQAEKGEWTLMMQAFDTLLGIAAERRLGISHLVKIAIKAAKCSHGRPCLEHILNSSAVQVLEPLVVGLRLALGEKTEVAQEILSVGQDIADRITVDN